MTVDERRGYWERQLAAQLASGLSVRAWCREAGVAYGRFSYWRRRLQGELPLATVTLISLVEEPSSFVGRRIVVGSASIAVASHLRPSIYTTSLDSTSLKAPRAFPPKL